MRIGRWLHALMLPVALAAVSLLPRLKGGPGRWSACGRGSALWAASSLAGMTVPACVGGLRVLLTGVLPLTISEMDSVDQQTVSSFCAEAWVPAGASCRHAIWESFADVLRMACLKSAITPRFEFP